MYRYFSKYVTKTFLLFLLGMIFILVVHAINNEKIPRGLFHDEASIGYNAALIAESGYDEHGKFFPVYFESFYDYKPPLIIYTAAALFKIFGVSAKILRSSNALFFGLFFVSFLGITRELYGKRKSVLAYSMISAGFIPWLFTLSRRCLEAISQLATVSMAVYFIIRTFHSNSGNASRNALFAGITLGLSIYSYQAAKLLTPLLLLLTCVLYVRRSTMKRSVIFISTFALTCVPYIYFTITNPGGFTARFRKITHVYDTSLTLLQKIGISLENYGK
ncbi:MAG: hypothetical protein CMG78_03700, partial [Marinobacter sp.]|nr:hypothetical protein [Marinobacter sp.]